MDFIFWRSVFFSPVSVYFGNGTFFSFRHKAWAWKVCAVRKFSICKWQGILKRIKLFSIILWKISGCLKIQRKIEIIQIFRDVPANWYMDFVIETANEKINKHCNGSGLFLTLCCAYVIFIFAHVFGSVFTQFSIIIFLSNWIHIAL